MHVGAAVAAVFEFVVDVAARSFAKNANDPAALLDGETEIRPSLDAELTEMLGPLALLDV